MIRKNLDILQGLALVGQLGLVISLPLVLMVVLARFLSSRYGYDLTFCWQGSPPACTLALPTHIAS